MGLLDSLFSQGTTPPNPDATMPQLLSSPMGQGLLGGLFSYAANARRGTPINNIGRGGMGGLLAYSNAQQLQDKTAEEAQQRQMRAMQLQQLQRSVQDQQLADETAKKFFRPSVPGVMGDANLPPELQTGAVVQPGSPASFDMRGFANARMAQNPTAGMALLAQLQKETPINKLDVKDFTPASVAKFSQSGNYGDLVRLDKLHFADNGGATVGLDPFTGRQVSTSPKSGNPFSDLLVAGPDGRLIQNSPLIGAKKDIANAGAARTNIAVNTEKSLLNEIAGGLGKNMTTAQEGARSALGTINTVNRLNEAIDSGNVMAGPGSTFRQYGLQLGSMLGVGGKDAQEKLLNTRQAVQSLAQLELDGAQQMKGQGQITEAERSIIKRAASGDIESMTVPELRLLGGVLDRSARTKIRGYNEQVRPLTTNPNAAALAPFLTVQEPPERKPASSVVRRFNPSTGRIE